MLYSFFYAGTALGDKKVREGIKSTIKGATTDALKGATGTTTDANLKAIGDAFADAVNTQISKMYPPIFLEEQVFALPFIADGKKDMKEQMRVAVYHATELWADRVINAETVKAYAYLANEYNVSEKTEASNSSTTTASNSSTGKQSGNVTQKFNSGINTASAGTANKTDNTETSSASGTSSATTSGTSKTPREYDGRPEDLINANKFARIPVRVAQTFASLFIPAEDVPAELIAF